ncbi:hypothetical protein H8356DRAFT_1299533 [Neocallimastix lanati (nom. inval.)]|uniref:Uncharacterized protein n=1 Tax=Neocallimastix californiae TaxID=1754190 RepID=A0A1Y1ZRG9_9FUNG|nr:hypothetical protein H8356DRAFT_1299533 [Neocallimastix sp. JGI-2020a]ORY12794.1 hypothetical protein LY90DRAFT_636873 [Neocallimastix californiae]|eukprot:ORY12794.1 hypothetical protein LY90DRAFT_636873 [Neocallimastix californiae]
MNSHIILKFLGNLVIAVILGIGIGSILIFFYKFIKKLINRNNENKNELPLYKSELLKSSDTYITPINSPMRSDSKVSLYPSQKILQTTEEEQNINTINTINRLIDRDKAKQKANTNGSLI